MPGAPAVCIVDDHYELKVIASKIPQPILSDEVPLIHSATKLSTFTVNARGKTVVTVTMVERKYSVPFAIEVTTANKKVLKGSGTWYGCANIDSSTEIKTECLDDSKE